MVVSCFIVWQLGYVLDILLINTCAILDFILIGGILPYLERKKLALIQRRVGPKYVGLNGRLQFIVDALKIFFKDYFYIFKVKKYYFFLLPVLFLIYNLYFLINFQWSNNIYMHDIEINIIFLVIFSSISNILVFLTGYICKNKYTVITSSRSVSVFFINELLMTLVCCHFFFYQNHFLLVIMLYLHPIMLVFTCGYRYYLFYYF